MGLNSTHNRTVAFVTSDPPFTFSATCPGPGLPPICGANAVCSDWPSAVDAVSAHCSCQDGAEPANFANAEEYTLAPYANWPGAVSRSNGRHSRPRPRHGHR